MSLATQIRSLGELTTLNIANIPDGAAMVRDGDEIVGVPTSNFGGTITPAVVTTGYDWGASTESSIFAQYSGADFNVLLPAGDDLTWEPGTVRTLFTVPFSANSVVLVAADDSVIQSGVAGEDYAIPGSDVAISTTQLCHTYQILRGSAPYTMYFFVFGVTPAA